MPALVQRFWFRLFYCLLAGGLACLAFAPYSFAWLIIPSLAVLVYCLNHSGNQRHAFLLGYAWGLGLFGSGIYWLYISINLFGGVNLLGAYSATAAMIAFHALYPAVFAVLIKRTCPRRSTLALLLLIPALWTLLEWSRTWMLTGFPWLSIGYTQTDTLLAGYAPIAGVYGIGFVLALLASALALGIHATLRQRLLLAGIAGLLLAGGLLLHDTQWTDEKDQRISVALIQGAIPQQQKWQAEMKYKTVEIYRDLTEDYWGMDLVIWPETALPFFYHDEKALMEELARQAERSNTELLLGIPYSKPGARQYYNSVIAIGPSKGIYLKRHLVPFGEYLPLDSVIRPLLHFLQIPMSSFSAGQQDKPIIQLLGEDVGISICYEDVFGEQVIQALPEASLLVNVSNDAWFGDSAAPHQHLQMARMRAIETGRYLLRATNNGISAIIDQHGRLIDRSPQFTAHALSAEVKLFSGHTPYSYIGNTLIILLCSLILLIAVIYRPDKSAS